jgi:hypothetical protein
MSKKLLVSAGLVLFALVGCEEYPLVADGQDLDVQIVYVNGQPDHCIIVPKGQAMKTPLMIEQPPRSVSETPAMALVN